MIAEAHRAMAGKPGRLAVGLMAIAAGDTESVHAKAALLRIAQFVEAHLER